VSVLTNPTIQSTFYQFNGNSFGGLCGFGKYSSSNATYYYVMDFGANKVYILNDDWSFISSKYLDSPSGMISINNSLYMIGNSNVWKVDKDLNILINYNSVSANYLGISYNPSNGLIYVAAQWLKEIQVFNLDLTLIRRFSTQHNPMSIAVSSNQLYVGTTRGIILVYQNELIINQFNGCNGNSGYLTFILFDQNGYMATTCTHPTPKLYLFSPGLLEVISLLPTPEYPYYIGFDSKDRFFQISWKQISIYN
jgi:hypothetical protein